MFTRAVSAIRRSTSLTRKKDDEKVSDSEESVASASSSSTRRRRFFRRSTAKNVASSQSAYEIASCSNPATEKETEELSGFSDATVEKGWFVFLYLGFLME